MTNAKGVDIGGVVGLADLVAMINMQVATANAAVSDTKNDRVVELQNRIGIFLIANITWTVEYKCFHVAP